MPIKGRLNLRAKDWQINHQPRLKTKHFSIFLVCLQVNQLSFHIPSLVLDILSKHFITLKFCSFNISFSVYSILKFVIFQASSYNFFLSFK